MLINYTSSPNFAKEMILDIINPERESQLCRLLDVADTKPGVYYLQTDCDEISRLRPDVQFESIEKFQDGVYVGITDEQWNAIYLRSHEEEDPVAPQYVQERTDLDGWAVVGWETLWTDLQIPNKNQEIRRIIRQKLEQELKRLGLSDF